MNRQAFRRESGGRKVARGWGKPLVKRGRGVLVSESSGSFGLMYIICHYFTQLTKNVLWRAIFFMFGTLSFTNAPLCIWGLSCSLG